jgi:hypothetical protein
MKYLLLILIASIAMTSSIQAQTARKKSVKVLRHVVLVKFKGTATPEEIHKAELAFHELPSKIKEIRNFEWGKNNSPENLNAEFTHCFFVTFASEKDRDAYLPHPEHKAFTAILKPIMDKVLVIDYWTEK